MHASINKLSESNMPPRKRLGGEMRLKLLKVWDYHCSACNEPIPHCCVFDDGDKSINDYIYDIDHLHSLGTGGEDELFNLHVLCVLCHRVKSRREQLSGYSQCPRCLEAITRENHNAREPHACIRTNHRGDPVRTLQAHSGPWFNQRCGDLRELARPQKEKKKKTVWKQIALFRS